MKATPPWSPSAWPFAKHWPARARPSASLLPLALTSPSLWTPGARITQSGDQEEEAEFKGFASSHSELQKRANRANRLVLIFPGRC